MISGVLGWALNESWPGLGLEKRSEKRYLGLGMGIGLGRGLGLAIGLGHENCDFGLGIRVVVLGWAYELWFWVGHTSWVGFSLGLFAWAPKSGYELGIRVQGERKDREVLGEGEGERERVLDERGRGKVDERGVLGFKTKAGLEHYERGRGRLTEPGFWVGHFNKTGFWAGLTKTGKEEEKTKEGNFRTGGLGLGCYEGRAFGFGIFMRQGGFGLRRRPGFGLGYLRRVLGWASCPGLEDREGRSPNGWIRKDKGKDPIKDGKTDYLWIYVRKRTKDMVGGDREEEDRLKSEGCRGIHQKRWDEGRKRTQRRD
ncbi:hypothetical protein H6P81_010545 [Aristolochia fimbriata]|uniref:Uncharacterized protein n=1 Tax=Aristolochia fimbriata TaxID=158543 RepID=A0AAV7ER62_ARIFI|nr:hypothetical protein H6P81_010545 [Aristolochia fimbriata]